MMIINKQEYETLTIELRGEIWNIRLLVGGGSEGPYRFLHDKKEIVVLNQYHCLVCHLTYDNQDIHIIQKDSNFTISIKENELLIFNYQDE